MLENRREYSYQLAASNGQAENAQIFYDAYRCARCPQPLAVGSSADLSSSFFQMIDLLHTRLQAYTMLRIRQAQL